MMKILKLLTATILLSAFSHSAFADEQADAQMITNSTFCAMYSTRLTQTSDSGLQVKALISMPASTDRYSTGYFR
ncbi:hypothetical protein M5585_00520 [Serratia ureilytica]